MIGSRAAMLAIDIHHHILPSFFWSDWRFAPLFDELQRRAAVVFVHPTASPDAAFHQLGLPDSLLDFPVDTSRALANLHYTNTFARAPAVKYIFSHAGGTESLAAPARHFLAPGPMSSSSKSEWLLLHAPAKASSPDHGIRR